MNEKYLYEKPTTGIAVDGETRGNPGMSKYRGVSLSSGEILFEYKLKFATNNICEFLALVHAIGYALKNNYTEKIYTDSVTALTWLKNKKCKSTLKQSKYTQNAINLIDRAEKFLRNLDINRKDEFVTCISNVSIEKWLTSQWGEIPADYGNKK